MLAKRFNNGKPEWSLVDFKSLEEMTKVLSFGKEKYSAHNWRKGLSHTQICESLLRHLFAYMEGEDKDSESGLHHIAHVQCNAMFLMHMIKNKPKLDDRFRNTRTTNKSNARRKRK